MTILAIACTRQRLVRAVRPAPTRQLTPPPSSFNFWRANVSFEFTFSTSGSHTIDIGLIGGHFWQSRKQRIAALGLPHGSHSSTTATGTTAPGTGCVER